jgi:anaerobic dimethyl sulfoxide reductase subunit B (iron-sulfur subunit)
MSAPLFSFDSTFCSGCKACVMACKDKHGLEVGRQWRRVYEIGAGGWQPHGEGAWQPNFSAYYLSLACNHCERPICVEVCPSNAMHTRPDGLVLIDASRCLGCLYCAWACPYGAPQYHAAAGVMTKCTYCVEETEQGLPPACVAACPMRTLEAEASGQRSAFSELTTEAVNGLLPRIERMRENTSGLDGGSSRGEAGRQTPLNPFIPLTAPRLAFQPHPSAGRPEERVVNAEEVSHPSESPLALVLFTVLVPLAVGLFALLGAAQTFSPVPPPAWNLWLPVICLVLAMGVSLLHLGHPLRAPLALAGWRHSWLSREILFAGLTTFGATAVAAVAASGGRLTELLPGLFVATLAGGGLTLYSIGRVYRLGSVPHWDGPLPQLGLWLSTVALGLLAGGALFGGEALPETGALLLLVSALLAGRDLRRVRALCPGLFSPRPYPQLARVWRWRLLLAVLCAPLVHFGLAWLALPLALAAEALGRLGFYWSHPNGGKH